MDQALPVIKRILLENIPADRLSASYAEKLRSSKTSLHSLTIFERSSQSGRFVIDHEAAREQYRKEMVRCALAISARITALRKNSGFVLGKVKRPERLQVLFVFDEARSLLPKFENRMFTISSFPQDSAQLPLFFTC